ncbi:hypothetical protein ACFL4Y_00520 [Gemmatimonadota bacterium]
MRSCWLALVVLFLAEAACAGGGGKGESYFRVDVDTDGIRTAENGSVPSKWDGVLPVLVLEEVVRVGSLEGAEEYLISSPWLQVAVSPDGAVGYLERSPNELRIYDEEGLFRFRAGRSGQGPGEWRFSSVLDHAPGLGWAVAASPFRLVLWDRNGGLLETIGIGTLPRRILNRMAVTAEGALWYFADESVTWGTRMGRLIRANWRTLEADTVLTARRWRQEQVKDYGLSYSYPQSMSLGPEGRVWTNVSLEYRIEVFGGSREERFRVSRAYEPIPDPEHGREPGESDRPSMMEDYRLIYAGHHKVLPAIQSLSWVDGSELWVFTSIQTDTASVQVDVFDPRGKYVRAFSAPVDLARARAGVAAGHIWWLRTEQDDIPALVRYSYRFEAPR